ncbi:MAG: tetratricopeptide repeat protein [candidate division Zixibacteria bacterium]|nr:tetratricopeptide repeat protein [candidate division Zixibacteria bacterium]
MVRSFSSQWVLRIVVAVVLMAILGGCVYYNTFYNAKKAFNAAEKSRKGATHGRRGNVGGYKRAIEKSLKVIENYPNSKYYDDALYVLMVSYFHTDQYSRSERRAREILANYPESKFTRKALLYLAKAKLMQRDIDDAMSLFQEIFESDYKKAFKAEAAKALGTYYFDNRDYISAEPYFLALRDSMGTEEEQLLAQKRIAEGYFERYHHKDALSAYLQILGMNPDKNSEFLALYRATSCSYRMQRIDEGQDYLRTLIENELYYDSLGMLELKMAEGYEYDEDLIHAEASYRNILEQEENRDVRARAFWNLGLIYQYDYDKLAQAKEYYDSTIQLSRSSEIGKAALQHSSDIGKREVYMRTVIIDSTTTQEVIDEAAYTQYQLAELYWFQLNKPDTGILEMQYIVDSLPTAYDAPKAMIALSEMTRKHEQDSLRSDSILREMLVTYPNSDYVPEALDILNLIGTEADTGYAGKFFKRAEYFLVDEQNIDSARANYQIVTDRFPDSKYNLQARFALVWLTETYESPGDSSVIWAYNELIDSFPNTFWSNEAGKRTQYQPRPKLDIDQRVDSTALADAGEGADSWGVDNQTGAGAEDTSTYVDPLEAVYVGPNGERLINLPIDPIRVEERFVYPTEAYRLAWWGDLYFQVLLDFSGEVVDHVLMIKSESEEINRRAEEAVASMTFDPSQLREELQNRWLVYKYRVVLPDHLR